MFNLPSFRVTSCVLLAWGMLGCSQSSDVLTTNLNACLIVSEADVELAIGTPVTTGVRHNDRQCLYQAKRNPQETVTVEFDSGPDGNTKSLFRDKQAKPGRQPIPGIGEGAFTLRSPIGGIELTFLKNDALVTLSLVSSKQSNPQAAVTSLAKVAANKLAAKPLLPVAVASAALGSESTGVLPEWGGDWYGCVPVGLMFGKGHLALSERADWTLTTAVVMPGTVVADRGSWQAESYQEILHGTYRLAGSDRFSTTGNMSVDWNKIPKNQAPRKFDPLLWQSFGSLPRKMTVKRLAPVEPALIGMWEGSAKFVDRQEEFVWTITSANVSEFYKATTQTGRVEPEGDRFKLIPARSKTLPLSMQVFSRDKMELTDNSGAVSQWHRNEKLLPRC